MKTALNNKSKTAAIISLVLLLMASVAFMLIAMPVQAQTSRYLDPDEIPTNVQDSGSIPYLPSGVTPDLTYEVAPYLSIAPNPLGVGQQILVNVWVGPALQYQYFSDYKITITDPDGNEDELVTDSYPADCTAWFLYVVDQVGTWKLKFDFPGGYFPAGNYSIPQGAWAGAAAGGDRYLSLPLSRWYEPNSDGPYDLVVQEDMVFSWPPAPLPTDYWTRPISPENREWWPIAGYYPSTGVVGGGPDWPAGTNTFMSNYLYTPYVQAPNTAHIVWRRQSEIGGLQGGSAGYWSFTSRGNTPSIIFQGRCYDSVTKMVDGEPQSVWQSYDLRTGQVYWRRTDVPAAQWVMRETALPEVVGAQAGSYMGRTAPFVLGTISGGRLIKYYPSTGDVYQNISIAPLTSGTYYACYDFAYFLSTQRLADGSVRLINWTAHGETGPSGRVINEEMRVMNNISWPFSSVGYVDYELGIAANLARVTSAGSGISDDAYVQAASIYTGQLLWNHTTGFYSYSTYSGSIADQGKFVIHMTDGRIHCYDLTTGVHVWDNDISTQDVWRAWFSYGIQSYGGNLISNQYNGIAAYDWDTGDLSWLYQAPTPYQFETPYQGYYSFFTTPDAIADGKIYAYNGEHTATQPITRGWGLHCINATNGEGIWNITGSMQPGGVADGYLTGGNSYDGYLYVFGKGKSATTVSAPDTAVPKGTAVLIKGTVMDMSPGDQGSFDNPTARLDSPTAPGTVPCVSAASMSTLMEYLYMQRPIDGVRHNVMITGVPVILTAIDSDGTVYDLGTVTTNGYYGTFSYAWTPPDEGTYEIIASFNGDDSYGSSAAATAVAVGPAPSPSAPIEPEPTEPEPTEPEPTEPEPTEPEPTEPTEPEPTEPEPTEPTEAPFITIEIAIIAAVVIAIIIGIASFWALRRRK